MASTRSLSPLLAVAVIGGCSIFMGEFIYAISDRAITVHRVSDLAKVTDATLPGYTPGDYYWWW